MASPNQLTIVKVVSGPVTTDAKFTVSVVCDDDIIEGGDTDYSATVKFDSTGQPTTASVIHFRLGTDQLASCTVTETANGGASSTTFACEDDTVEADIVEPPPAACPEAGPVASQSIVVKVVSRSTHGHGHEPWRLASVQRSQAESFRPLRRSRV